METETLAKIEFIIKNYEFIKIFMAALQNFPGVITKAVTLNQPIQLPIQLPVHQLPITVGNQDQRLDQGQLVQGTITVGNQDQRIMTQQITGPTNYGPQPNFLNLARYRLLEMGYLEPKNGHRAHRPRIDTGLIIQQFLNTGLTHNIAEFNRWVERCERNLKALAETNPPAHKFGFSSTTIRSKCFNECNRTGRFFGYLNPKQYYMLSELHVR